MLCLQKFQAFVSLSPVLLIKVNRGMKRVIFLLSLLLILLFAGLAWGQVPEEVRQPNMLERLLQMAPMLLMVFLIFYLMVLKPQNDEQKRHADLIESLRKGQSVVTTSGLIGRVAGIDEDYILLEVSSNVRVKVEKEHIQKARETGSTKKS
jgi:preprotein translocase subunit YajC